MKPVNESQMRLILKAQSYGEQEIEAFVETVNQVQNVDFEFEDLVRVDQLSPTKHAGLRLRNLTNTISGEFTDLLEGSNHEHYIALSGTIHKLSPYDMVVITYPDNSKGGNPVAMFPQS